MELRHIRYFLAVAQTLNFTRAAQKLMIAQPPLSRQIRDLEEELGVPLFIRHTHDVRLTEEGALFRQYALQILELADKSMDAVRQMNQGLHGTLTLSMVEGSAPHLAARWIAGFHKVHPNVQYDLWNGNSDDVAARVQRGVSELAVIVAPYNAQGLQGMPVYEEPWAAIMRHDHPLASAYGNSLPLSALNGCDLMVPSRQSRQEEIGGWFSRIGETPRIICRLSNTMNAIDLAQQGVGVAIYPASLGEGIGAVPGSVCIKQLDEKDIRARYVLIRARGRTLSRVASEFWHYVEKQTEA